MNNKLTTDAMLRELASLKRQYRGALDAIADRVASATAKLESSSLTVSSHDAFNIGASVSELTTLAGRIEQTENVIRWMEAK